MAADDVEKRLSKLESRVESMVDTLNGINQKAHDRIVAVEKRVESMVKSLNDINKTAHDRIVGLEKKFAKLDKTSAKLTKVTDPRTSERSITEVVDKALAAYDKARKK